MEEEITIQLHKIQTCLDELYKLINADQNKEITLLLYDIEDYQNEILKIISHDDNLGVAQIV